MDTYSRASPSTGDGRIVVGKSFTNYDGPYGSVEVDELIFFNQAFTSDDIMSLYTEA